MLDKINLDKSGPIPLYQQLERAISVMIESGALKSGDRLPDGVQIAQSLGVSIKTVKNTFRVLSEKGLVIRKRHAGTFVAQPEQNSIPTIGFFYLHEAELFMSKVASHIQRYCALHNYNLKIVSFDLDYYNNINLHQEFTKRNLKGAMLVAVNTEGCRKSFHALEESGFPHVRFGNAMFQDELSAPLVRGDDAGKTRMVIDYLRRKGHSRIGLAYFERGSDVEQEYLNFYDKNGCHKEEWLMRVRFSGPPEKWTGFPEPGMAADYIERNPDITAVIVENGSVCAELMQHASRAGKSLPRDLSFVCLADWPGLNVMVPPVTAIKVPGEAMAERACQILFDIMENNASHSKRVDALPYELIERDSVFTLGL